MKRMIDESALSTKRKGPQRMLGPKNEEIINGSAIRRNEVFRNF
jgi:hypothetical protein